MLMLVQVGAWQWKLSQPMPVLPILLPVIVCTHEPSTSVHPDTVASHFGTLYLRPG